MVKEEEEPSLDELEKQLKDKDGGVRYRAIRELGKIQNPQAVELLLLALNDEFPSFRAHAIYSLAYNPLFGRRYFEFQHVVDPLIQALKDENYQVKINTIQALGRLKNPKAIEPLEQVEKGDDIVIHRLVSGALRELNEIKAMRPVVRELFEDLLKDDMKVRESAINSLATVEDKNPVEHERIKKVMLRALEDKYKTLEKKTRVCVNRALGDYDDIEVVRSLVKELKNQDEEVKVTVTDSLRQIKDKLIHDFSDKVLEDKEFAIISLYMIRQSNIFEPKEIMELLISSIYDSERNVMYATLGVLREIGDRRVVETLIKSLNDTDIKIKLTTIEALGQLKDHLAVDPLILVLKEEDKNVRMIGIKALEQFPDMKVIETIIELLKDEDKEVRITAAQTLGHFKDTRAVEPLIEALNDEYWDVKVAVAYALGEIKDTRAEEPLRLALEDEEDLEVRKVFTRTLDEILKSETWEIEEWEGY